MATVSNNNILARVDKQFDYLPVVSTLNSITGLFIKCVVIPSISHEVIHSSHYFTRLKNKPIWLYLVLLIPLIGNLIAHDYNSLTDKETIIRNMRNPEMDRCDLKSITSSLQDDKEVVLAAVKRKPSNIEFASERLQNDIDILRVAISGYYLQAMKFITSRETALAMVKLYPQKFFSHANKSFSDDKDLMKIGMRSMRKGWRCFIYASERLKDDDELVSIAIRQDGSALKYASERLRDDEETVLAAVKQDPEALKYASERLKEDKDVSLAAIELNRYALRFVKNKEAIIATIKKDYNLWGLIGIKFKYHKDVIMALVEQNGLRLKELDLWSFTRRKASVFGYSNVVFVEPGCLIYSEAAERAVRQNALALGYTSPYLKADRDIVLAAVRQNGLALRYASEDLKDDEHVVLAAVRQNPDAFQYASEKIRTKYESGDNMIHYCSIISQEEIEFTNTLFNLQDKPLKAEEAINEYLTRRQGSEALFKLLISLGYIECVFNALNRFSFGRENPESIADYILENTNFIPYEFSSDPRFSQYNCSISRCPTLNLVKVRWIDSEGNANYRYYDRGSITDWLKHHSTDPFSRRPLRRKDLLKCPEEIAEIKNVFKNLIIEKLSNR
ncbi:MAG TPA: DUF4116 domain-containing protein [Chlamydiales bacterium]|nr:DUF4116 domain-containing protein [Chlamydiales bacterium]